VVTVVDAAGHSPHVERPDHVASLLTEFLSA
jgi:pimeloyl-ACP methyl ester carboxylesterase